MLLHGGRSERTLQLSALLEGYRMFHDFNPGELALMRDLHAVFDPRGLANPDKVLPEAPAEEGRTYTVVSGDSLWKIAEAMYGNGSNYTKIFDANRDILDDPDKIFPGQVLKIPDLDD